MDYRASAEMPYSCRQLFDLVADIERYPEFLPNWRKARVLRSEANRLHVIQQLGVGPLPYQFQSTALLECYSSIHIRAEGGPLKKLLIDWRFAPGDGDQTRIELAIELRLSGGRLTRPLEAMMSESSRHLMPYFERRAGVVYR